MKLEQNKNIDFSKVISSDKIEEIADIVKGVKYLLCAMELIESENGNEETSNGLRAVQITLSDSIKNITALKPNLEYMDNFMRYGGAEK